MVGRMQGVFGGKGYLAMPVRRTQDGRWRYRVVVDLPGGDQIRISGSAPRHNNNKDAARQAEKEHILRALTEASAPKEPVQEAPTVNEFVKSYLEISTLKNKPSSIKAKESLLRMHLLPRVGHLKLDQVTYAVIEDLKVDLAKTPLSNFTRKCKQKPKNEIQFLSQKTINNCLTVLRRMLSIARKRGMIASVPEVEWLRAPLPEFDFLDFEESQRLIDAAEGEWRTMMLTALRTGLRFGELLALRWQDVDLVAGRIVVRQNWVLGQIGTPKSGHAREIPLGEEVLKALKSHRHLRGPLVFCTMGGEVFTVGEPRYWLARVCRKAGLREIGWHTLRHTFASHLAMRGAPLKAIQELLGHATIQMTMRYAHLAPEVARDAVRLLDTNEGRGKTVAKPPEIAAN
jgi:integrase